jgi:hypothetical protein
LADQAGLRELADAHLSVPTDRGANAGWTVASLVGGMVAGADSIDDMAILRHGGMGRLFARIYAPSTLGSFLRAFTFGHIRQLDAVAARFLLTLAKLTALFAASPVSGDGDPGTYALVDVDDTVVEVHGHAKQGAGFGYNRIRGLNALLATLTTTDPGSCGSVIVAQRLRKGACNSSRGGSGWSVTRSRPPADSSTATNSSWCGWTPRSTDAGRCTPPWPVVPLCRSRSG